MSSPTRKPKTVSVPRKSGSIILCRENTPSSFQALFLRRSKQLAFGGIHAFPGGNFEENDSAAVNNNKDYELYVTCCRELFEETGLLIGAEEDRMIIQDIVMEEVNKQKKSGSNNKGISYFEIMAALNKRRIEQQNQSAPGMIDTAGYYAKLMHPFFRIVTIQEMPKRWDTQFYIAMLPAKGQSQQQSASSSVSRLFNYAAAMKHSNVSFLDDTDNVLINEESDQFSWETPQKAIQLHFSNELKLAVPQLLILSIMSSFSSFTTIHSYYEAIIKQQQLESTLSKVNAFKHDPARFPVLLQFKANPLDKSQKVLLICGDKDYPLQEILAKEPESKFKEELAEKSKSVVAEISSQQRLRVNTDLSTFIKIETNLPFLTPFTLMQQQVTQQHPQSPKPSL